MLADKRVLGLCLTKLHDAVRGELADTMNRAAVSEGYKLICFNSFEDFYEDTVYSRGAKSVYDRMDLHILDGVIVCAEHFFDDGIVDEIVGRARGAGLPVVIINGEREGCFSVSNDCRDVFQDMVRHLIREHHVTDLFFIAGRRERDPDSRERLSYYREVLEESGIAFDESRIGYGEYWDGPAMEIVEELAHSGKLPQAFVCANDSMAFGVCRKLKELGLSVPEDVIVTGFDGVPAGEFFHPRLTTCREDREGLARSCMDIFKAVFQGKTPKTRWANPYIPIFSESCGCGALLREENKEDCAALYHLLEEMEAHEDYLSPISNEMLKIEDVEELYEPLSKCILRGSVFGLNSSFLRLASGGGEGDNRTVVIPSFYDENRQITRLPDGEMLPSADGFTEDSSYWIITSVYAKDMCCGYFAVRTDRVSPVRHKLIRISRVANLVFHSLINQFRQKNVTRDIENVGYLDSMTGLPNLRGASRWFEEFSAVESNHRKTVAVSIYALPQYTYIYENYGVHEIEKASVEVADCLKRANRRDCFLARISDSEYLVIHYFSDPGQVSAVIQASTSVFYSALAEYNQNSKKEYYVEVNAGCTVADAGWSGKLEVYTRFASGEMFLNRLKQGTAEAVRENITYKDYYNVFNLLMDNNLFVYHFQPIVDAKTGEIYAYEALMRTSGGINLSPLDVLDIAREYKRLGEIEHATLFNVMKRYAEEPEKFKNRKVFINTIPNHFLSDDERNELISNYREYFDSFVFEVTEQESSSDEEMAALKQLCGEKGETQIAVDDYGTGHSNIVNLLRYSPQIIKIDRYLIRGIDSDTNKQMFVKNTIEFATMNNIKVLAEGVETAEELRTVIGFGIDLIQGYYTGRPAEEPIEEIAESVRDEIIGENLSLSRFNNDKQRAYTAKNGETLNLISLALEKYTYINVVSGKVTIQGKKDCTVDMVIRVADNAQVTLVLEDGNLSGTDEPAIQLGQGSEVELEIRGFNSISKNGILVTRNSRLRLIGEGGLLINNNQKEGVGIGSRYADPYGEIVFEHSGRIKVVSSGDRAVSVGGGRSNAPIVIKSGILEVSGYGISVVGIGSAKGDADIRIEDAEVLVKVSGNEAVGIGTIKGAVRLTSCGSVNVISDGEKSVAIGSISGKEGMVQLEGGELSATIHCDIGAVIGSYSGSVSTMIGDCSLTVYGEGASATGIGSSMGSCVTDISGGIVRLKVKSAGAQPFGNQQDKLVISGGNILCQNEETQVLAVNSYGQRLHRELVEGDCFERLISAPGGEYLYTARRCPDQDMLSVYIP